MSLTRRESFSAPVKTQDYALPATTDPEKRFALFYDRNFPRFCDFAARVMNRQDAEDLVQDVMVKIHDHWDSIVAENPGPAYFLQAVKNAIIDASRAEDPQVVARVLDVEIEDIVGGFVTDARVEEKERVRTLDVAIAKMPERCRQAWVLIRENECTYQQAADLMGVEFHTAKRHIVRANALVREALTDAGYLVAARKQRSLPPSTEGNKP
jgi:RNA polymerase sigma-70 factor (ECF subfamily)